MVAANRLTDAEAAAEFLYWAMGAPASPDPPAPARLLRWGGPVALRLLGTVDERAPAALSVMAAFLAAATGHPVSAAHDAPGGVGNLGLLSTDDPARDLLATYRAEAGVFFPSARELEAFARPDPRASPTAVRVKFLLDRAGAITGGLLVGSLRGQVDRFVAALWPALLRMVGMQPGRGRPSGYVSTILVPEGASAGMMEPTPLDRLMLAMLYDPALRPGMAGREAAPLLPGIAARHRDWGGSGDLLAPPRPAR